MPNPNNSGTNTTDIYLNDIHLNDISYEVFGFNPEGYYRVQSTWVDDNVQELTPIDPNSIIWEPYISTKRVIPKFGIVEFCKKHYKDFKGET